MTVKRMQWIWGLALMGACEASTVNAPSSEEPVSESTAPADEPQDETRETVAPSGAELALSTGETVDIPEGALDQATEIVMTSDMAAPQPVAEVFSVAGPVLTLEPHGIEFDEPVELTLTFTPRPNVEAWRYAVVRLADELDTTWERVENAFPSADGTVSFTVQTFSIFAVVERQDGCLNSECSTDEDYYAARYRNCVSSGNSGEYCSGWLGCAGSFSLSGTTLTGTGELCETPCSEDVCVNGSCSEANEGGSTCVCFGGFEGETCETPVDMCPGDDDKTMPGACGCGVPDTNSDTDDIPDCNDGCPNDAEKSAAGVCGCGVSDIDSDVDGTPDCNDACPDDESKVDPGECGCGVAEGSCAPVCPCFDSSFVARVAGGFESACVLGFQGEQYIYSSAQGGFSDSFQNFVYPVVEVREYYDNQGFECSVNCGETESAECTPTVESIDEATHDACEMLIAADSNCQLR